MTVQVPGVWNVTVGPPIEHTENVDVEKVTGNPDVVVAVNGAVPLEKLCVAGAAKLMVCGAKYAIFPVNVGDAKVPLDGVPEAVAV